MDAERRTKLCQLPPYLCCRLLRFELAINPRTDQLEKRKVKDGIEFPMALDLAAVAKAQQLADGLELAPGEAAEYELACVLIHTGNDNAGESRPAAVSDWIASLSDQLPARSAFSAVAGHYTAVVRDDCQGGWWTFDDDRLPTFSSPNPLHAGIRDVRDKETRKAGTHSSTGPKPVGKVPGKRKLTAGEARADCGSRNRSTHPETGSTLLDRSGGGSGRDGRLGGRADRAKRDPGQAGKGERWRHGDRR